jgi:YetA-like protein
MMNKDSAIAGGTDLTVAFARMRGRASAREPITTGVPFARGVLQDVSRLALTDDTGSAVPLDAAVTEQWSDGSVRWALLDFVAGSADAEPARYRLALDGGARVGPHAVRVEVTASSVQVHTGPSRFTLRAGGTAIFDEVVATPGGLRQQLGTVLITDRDGREWPMRIARVECEHQGRLRATVKLEGHAGPPRRPLVDVTVRVQFFAGTAAVRAAVTLANRRRARHPGGIWELGDSGSVYLRDASVSFGLRALRLSAQCSIEPAHDMEPFERWLQIRQHSSRAYTIASHGSMREGHRATPAVLIDDVAGRIGLAVDYFWQNCPREIDVQPRAFSFRVFPLQPGELYELQGGERKTHRFTMLFGDDAAARDAIFWGREAAVAAVAPDWYCAASGVAHLSVSSASREPRYERLVAAAIEGNDSFERKRLVIDEFGWRNFGDIYADHENTFSGADGPIVSHYNNQYDAVGGFAAQFMRSGDVRWWRAMNELAWHVTDIDVYHTDRDKPAYNHGLFWHTFHYVPAGQCTHRSYPAHPKVCGGGPANEHNYAAGLRLHWLLTGDAESRATAIGLAAWVIAMDDGRKTVLRWLDPSPTGLASATQSPSYHGPGRGAGHSIMALLDGHRLTGEARFLLKAEELIRRCIHPADDIAARELLDAERRWSYVVFLQAVGRYLEHKAERGEVDEAYAYARASLLHYARWMADHEYPYLEKPQILEYPTETWAAQDIRKSDVFSYAAQHARGEDRARFLERAAFFFDASVSTLAGLETRTLARPVVLLLSNGLMQLSPDATAEAPDAVPAVRFGHAPRFVPQKDAAKRRLLEGAAGLAAILLVLLGWVAFIAS